MDRHVSVPLLVDEIVVDDFRESFVPSVASALPFADVAIPFVAESYAMLAQRRERLGLLFQGRERWTCREGREEGSTSWNSFFCNFSLFTTN